MKIGIIELLKSGQREFSDEELLHCLEAALQTYPLNEVYGKATVLEPYPTKISCQLDIPCFITITLMPLSLQ